MASKSKNPSQNQNREPEAQPVSNKSTGPWTFGYPQCVNKKESRLVCLHSDCEKYPFFCSSCEDESCQNEHQHKDKITSIGFKELIKRLITERKPPEEMEKSIAGYKTALQQLLKNVTEFVDTETKSVDEILKKTIEVGEGDQKIIQKLKDKKYQQIKGKELDGVWNKVAQTEHKKKLEKEAIQFINSKKVEVQEITQHFKDGLKSEVKPQNSAQSKSQASNVSQPKK